MPQQITLRPESLDVKQITRIADALTHDKCNYGEKYTPDQVRLALWRALEDKIETLLDDLHGMTFRTNFVEYLGEPSHFADPRSVRCAKCGHPRGDHIDDGACNNLPKTCECFTFIAAPPKQITFTNADPRVYDGLGEIRWTADKRCVKCEHTEFYIRTNWYDGCCREQPYCINCNTVLIGLPVDADARRLVLAQREPQEEGPNTL